MALLQKEGRIDLPKTWLTFSSNDLSKDSSGQLLFSMQIIPKAEAEASPVGEA